jgi:hypothetical protein
MNNKPIWDWAACDPRNTIGESVVNGRDSLYRTRAVEHCHVGNRSPRCHYYTLTRNIPAVMPLESA